VSREDYNDPLYRECINRRPSPKPGNDLGPTEQWRRVEAQRLLWDLAAEHNDDPSLVGDGQVAS